MTVALRIAPPPPRAAEPAAPYVPPDPPRARALLGYAPLFNLEEGLRMTVAYYRERMAEGARTAVRTFSTLSLDAVS